jgi:hypothetical protein
MTEYNISFKENALQYIITKLVDQPYKEVAWMIADIEQQVKKHHEEQVENDQQKQKEEVPKTDKTLGSMQAQLDQQAQAEIDNEHIEDQLFDSPDI